MEDFKYGKNQKKENYIDQLMTFHNMSKTIQDNVN